MHALLCALLATAVVADDSQERRSKLPYIADAVGNSLPAPSIVPATVGSPVNLLTPDRYEFYTFDESGELVKRLMTLEEIQAIVAAGEETEGLVTFANDNQPTIAFNFSQPSYTKVHNVVTNVQNVLKAQMEAHKNRTNIPPTLDTPDVSDSWSQILPSIFGNTGGVDIVPDRTSETFITPETETIEFENTNENYLSKDNELTPDKILSNDIPVKVESTTIPTTSTTKPTTTRRITTTTTKKPTSKTTTTSKPTSTTQKIIKSSTVKLLTSSTTSTTTTTKPSTTVRSTTKTKTTPTTAKPTTSNTNKYKSTTKSNVKNSASTKDNSNKVNEFNKITPQYEKFSTFIPTSATTKATPKTTEKPSTTTKSNILVLSTSVSSLPSSSTESQINDEVTKLPASEQKFDKVNVTTITTQSISPSTIVSSTENVMQADNNTSVDEHRNDDINNEPVLPLFDVAQSISQIASDLGNYAPLPTSEDALDTDKVNDLSLESKENLEFDIPADVGPDNNTKVENNASNNNFENYVKISTLDPQKNDKDDETNSNIIQNYNNFINTTDSAGDVVLSTTVSSFDDIDPILSNSVGDMLSQVIHENPVPNAIDQSSAAEQENISTTQTILETTTSFDDAPSTAVTEVADVETTSIPATTYSIALVDENSDKKTKKTEEVEKLHLKTDIPNATPTEKIKSQLSKKNNTFLEAVNELNIAAEKERNKSSVFQNSGIINNNLLHITSSTTLRSPGKTETTIKPSTENSNVQIDTSEVKKNSLVKNIDQHNTNNFKTNIEVPNIDDIKKKFQKVNNEEKEIATDRNSWKLIPTVPPPRSQESEKIKQKIDKNSSESSPDKDIILDFSNENQGLEVTTKDLGEDVVQFTELCNELAFRYWEKVIPNLDNKRSFVLSPFSVTSMLAMMFMGARGATSGEMNEILKLDDMVTFNPHFTLKNISDSIETSSNSGVAVSAFIRELYSERSKGKILTFYKERAQQFYNGHVEEVNFKLISDIIRRRTNLLVKRYTWGKIPEYIKSNSISMRPPLGAFSTNIFETDCTGSSVDGRDGEMYFVVSPNVRQRRLVPVPAVVYKNNFMAGYDPILDATAVALGNTNSVISTLFLMPGQQGNVVNAEDLESLEKRLLESKPAVATWNRLLRTLLPRIGLELQIPRFSHKSMLNISSPLKKMGLKELFDSEHADLAGLNGPSKDIYLSDMLQLTTFVTCGEGTIGEQHHIEEYPEISQQKRRSSRWATIWDEPRDYQRAFHDPHDLGDAMHLPLHLRPRQARLPARNTQPSRRLKFDRPFLYFVRHNPTGMILYVGRYNPRLLP
ncbi:mucin-5AC [Aricia agestis]|uniref:mucin-5AC n=1 Tax=Aricia agestis TaxID=91739 RepID=UPI001C20A53B|nr:mucin-5AC [Aricia agestis]